jgi:SHS2 domain-containing protein
VSVNGQIVSSSRIRDLLREGRVEEASRLLGRCPSLSGKVVGGAGRGQNLGFPTANLEVFAGRVVPANGVYAVYALLGADRQPGVANIGVRPSFDGSSLTPPLRTIEIHLFDFEQDIYGCDLLVEFVARLRSERRFDDIQDLIAQIERDSQQARQILEDSACTLPGGAAWLSAAASQDASEANGDLPQSAKRTDRPVCDFRYEEVEHTADRALQIWARDLPNLFVGAARGMYSLMADIDGLVATTWRQINLEEWDLESLFVSWLNELLFLTETEGLLFTEFRFESLTNETLVAHVGGAPGSATRAGIKAATFHDLRLVREAGEWTTILTFDV